VLPDINADDGNESQERVLVGGGSKFKTLRGGVVALNSNSNLVRKKNIMMKS